MTESPAAGVVRSIRTILPDVDLMLVGAWCRNVLHEELGHSSPLAATADVDIALAVPSMDEYVRLTQAFPAIGSNQIRYLIAGVKVDLMPFGDVEEPAGEVLPPPRDQPMSVWGFREAYAEAHVVDLGQGTIVRVPSVAGYLALKLCAWLDRGEPKDAQDVGTVLWWYDETTTLRDRLGEAVLVEEDWDFRLGAARLAGADAAAAVGPVRAAELRARWADADLDVLARDLDGRAEHLPRDRRRALVDALTRGLDGAA